MGIVLETVQPVDGGRWERFGLDLSLVLLFFRCFYFCYLLTILSHYYTLSLFSSSSYPVFCLLFLLTLYLSS